MAKQAVGIIETQGLVALIEASDAALKAADITMIGWNKIGSGMVTGFYAGDVAAVKAGMPVRKPPPRWARLCRCR